MKNNVTHIILAVLLIALLILLSDPFMIWMPPLAATSALFLVATVMCIWAGFVMKESAGDEREVLHRMNAGRVAYLSGISVLTVAFVIQGIEHDIDPWIAVALAIMVVSKLVARLYFEKYR